MQARLDRAEVARSLELYKLQKHLKTKAELGEIVLELTREPFLRKREEVGKVVVAFGSYDPLSKAHESLFLRGVEAVRARTARSDLSELLIVTSTVHFEKSVDLQKNSAIYDRIHAQEGFASCYGNVSLALFNDPYFVNLIPAIEAKYGKGVSIYFVVGSDVMEKVVDPEGYRIRGFKAEDVLPRLFKQNFIVSERSNPTLDGKNELVTLDDLKKKFPVLRDYEDHLLPLDLRGEYKGLIVPIQEVSSKLIRKRRNAKESVLSLEAVGISDFVDRRGIYLQNDAAYASFAYARQRFVDEHPDAPIGTYLDELMEHLDQLRRSPGLRAKEIKDYCGPKRRKVLVINPPNKPFSDQSLLIEPIDALTTAAFVKSLGNEVKFVDMDAKRMEPDSIEPVIAAYKPDITIMGFDYMVPLYRSPAIPGLNRIGAIAKNYGSKVVVGGRRSKHNPEWFLDGNIDVAIGSEMEEPLERLLSLEYWFPETLRSVNGIAYRTKTQGFITTSPRDTRINLDRLPMPDRSMVDLSDYIDVRTMWTSHGCNGKCAFCGTPEYWGKWRSRCAQNVVDEVAYLVRDCAAGKILFLDDNSMVSKARMQRICQGLIETGIETTLGCLSRVSSYDPELMETMHTAGFRWVHYGIESANAQVLNQNRKGITPKQIRAAIKGSINQGFRVRTSFILDLPGNNPKAMQETIDMIFETKPHEIRIHYLALREGTELYHQFYKPGGPKRASQYIHQDKPTSWSPEYTTDQILADVSRLVLGLESMGYLVVRDPKQLGDSAIVCDPNTRFVAFCPARYGIGWKR